jgi:hypothetical protein
MKELVSGVAVSGVAYVLVRVKDAELAALAAKRAISVIH